MEHIHKPCVPAAVLLAVALAASFVCAQSERRVEAIPVREAHFNDRTMNILVSLAQKYSLVVGISGVMVGGDRTKINVSLPSGTVKDLLDLIVEQDPRFEWREVQNGVIHVSFKGAPLRLMDITVASFTADNPNRANIVSTLADIPEVNRWLRERGCQMDEIIAGPQPNNWAFPFSVHINDQPFASLLDEIAINSHTYFWSVIQYGNEPCAINVRP